MKNYVIWVKSGDQKRYVYVDLNSGDSRGVEDPLHATLLPGIFAARSVLRSLKPVVQKQYPDVTLGYEAL